MKVHVKLKDSDYLKFSEYQLTHSKQGKRTIFLQRLTLPLISIAMVIAFVAFHASTRAIIIEVVSLGIASAIWVIGSPAMLKSSVKRDFYKKKNSGSAEIIVTDEDGQEIALYVVEETRMNGCSYLLAADSEEGDGDCYILKDVSGEEEAEAVYEFVEDDAEAESIFRIFQELMTETGVELSER